MDRYYMPVSRDEDDSIDHQYKVYDYSSNDYQRSTKAMPSKMKTKYWLSKQQIKQKLGKEEDEWVVKGDSTLDAKLSYFHHVNQSCNELLRLYDRMQHHLKGLSIQEMLLSKFLEAQSKNEGTEAGKMMSYIGYAEEYMSKKRNMLYPSITRIMTDLGVFQQKAVQDCSITVHRMEQFRTEFRASLLWLDDISQQLNPEDRDQLEKFRKVQSLTREKRKEFARMKDNTIQKIEILAASRINLFSARLEDYHKSYQKYLQSCINALKEVIAAKERLDTKIEEKRLADLEKEIDAHLPTKRSAKLNSSSYMEKDEDGKCPGDEDDEDLVNLNEDFGAFEAANDEDDKCVDGSGLITTNNNDIFDNQESLDEIFRSLSPALSVNDIPDFAESSAAAPPNIDLLSLSDNPADNMPSTAPLEFGGGLVGEVQPMAGPNTSQLEGNWFTELASSNANNDEAIDWTMMNDILTQPDEEQITGPATSDDLMCLNQALANLDTGLSNEEPAVNLEATDTATGSAGATDGATSKPFSGSNTMQQQQFNTWLNLFSDLDPIAQSKANNSGSIA